MYIFLFALHATVSFYKLEAVRWIQTRVSFAKRIKLI